MYFCLSNTFKFESNVLPLLMKLLNNFLKFIIIVVMAVIILDNYQRNIISCSMLCTEFQLDAHILCQSTSVIVRG